MLLKKKKPVDTGPTEWLVQKQEDLFTLLDDNYHRRFRDRKFWRHLQELDQELTPGCVYIEAFDNTPGQNLIDNDDTSDDFPAGSQTLVFRCKTKEGAIKGAKLLSRIFDGSGTKFVPEKIQQNDSEIYQVRSNIDKPHWEKLCVFCKYRFNREVVNQGDRDEYRGQAQRMLDAYTKDTDDRYWKANTGIPAFIGVMGLHGNLRPPRDKGPYIADITRVERELNRPHPHGVPHIFQGVIMHADVKQDGEISCISPYYIGFKNEKAAWHNATDGRSWGLLLMEMIGGNPFDKESALGRRVIEGMGLGFGITGVVTAGSALSALIGPLSTAAAGGTVLLATYAGHRWRWIDRLKTIRTNGNGKTVLKSQRTGKEITIDTKMTQREFELEYTAATEGGPATEVTDRELIAEAFSPQGCGQLEKLVENASNGVAVGVHEGRLSRQLHGMARHRLS